MAELVKNVRFVDQDGRTLAGIRFDDGMMGVVVDSYCDNPQCTSPEVMIVIEKHQPHDGGNLTVDEGMFCSFDLNINTWKISRIEPKGIQARLYAYEFLSELDSTLKNRFRRRWEQSKASKDPLVPPAEVPSVHDAARVLYAEAFQNSSSLLSLKFNGRLFAIGDLYCINPQCDCHEVDLMIVDITRGPKKNAKLDVNVLAVPMEGGAPTVKHTDDLDEATILLVYQHWQHGLRDKEILAKRHAQMKAYGREKAEIAARSASNPETMPVAKKIGRNVPCPCGSGKKYKKCCGRGLAI